MIDTALKRVGKSKHVNQCVDIMWDFLIAAAFFATVYAFFYFVRLGRRVRRREERQARWPRRIDAADQLRFVMGARFSQKTLMSRAEFRVFRIVEEAAKGAQRGLRVFAQTCLGEIIGTDDEAAFSAINAKRVDILVVDYSGLPVVAVEYQGGGHYQGNAAARDAIKKEALRRAGVAYVEVLDHDDDTMVRAKLDAVLVKKEPAAVGS